MMSVVGFCPSMNAGQRLLAIVDLPCCGATSSNSRSISLRLILSKCSQIVRCIAEGVQFGVVYVTKGTNDERAARRFFVSSSRLASSCIIFRRIEEASDFRESGIDLSLCHLTRRADVLDRDLHLLQVRQGLGEQAEADADLRVGQNLLAGEMRRELAHDVRGLDAIARGLRVLEAQDPATLARRHDLAL
jgi:hypothetical protein